MNAFLIPTVPRDRYEIQAHETLEFSVFDSSIGYGEIKHCSVCNVRVVVPNGFPLHPDSFIDCANGHPILRTKAFGVTRRSLGPRVSE
jgi:hypothetical protein